MDPPDQLSELHQRLERIENLLEEIRLERYAHQKQKEWWLSILRYGGTPIAILVSLWEVIYQLHK